MNRYFADPKHEFWRCSRCKIIKRDKEDGDFPWGWDEMMAPIKRRYVLLCRKCLKAVDRCIRWGRTK